MNSGRPMSDPVLKEGEMHCMEGLTFMAMPGGVVRVQVRDGVTTQFRFDLSAEQWASAVAHVSRRGESGDTFQAALEAHQQPPEEPEPKAKKKATRKTKEAPPPHPGGRDDT